MSCSCARRSRRRRGGPTNSTAAFRGSGPRSTSRAASPPPFFAPIENSDKALLMGQNRSAISSRPTCKPRRGRGVPAVGRRRRAHRQRARALHRSSRAAARHTAYPTTSGLAGLTQRLRRGGRKRPGSGGHSIAPSIIDTAAKRAVRCPTPTTGLSQVEEVAATDRCFTRLTHMPSHSGAIMPVYWRSGKGDTDRKGNFTNTSSNAIPRIDSDDSWRIAPAEIAPEVRLVLPVGEEKLRGRPGIGRSPTSEPQSNPARAPRYDWPPQMIALRTPSNSLSSAVVVSSSSPRHVIEAVDVLGELYH